MIINFNLKKLLISLAIPLATGGLAALITRDAQDIYSAFDNPPLSPPGWLFPIVWSILYLLMGVSLYLVWNTKVPFVNKKEGIKFWVIQLALNFIWSPIFFIYANFLLAFIVLVLILIYTVLMIINFYKVSKSAAYLQIPYLVWLVFAGYLNMGIYILNK